MHRPPQPLGLLVAAVSAASGLACVDDSTSNNAAGVTNKVTWKGNFTGHPLVGGVTGTLDPTSPITKAGPKMGTTSVDVTFGNVGEYPYYCQLHLQAIKGVIYLE